MVKHLNDPDIYQFKDPAAYLIEVIECKKKLDAKFSVRKWAAILDVKSDTLIDLLKNKKKFTSNLIKIISQNLNLDPNEEAYFIAMMKFSQAATIKEQNVLLLVLGEMASSHGSTVLVEEGDIFKHWVYVAILVMSELEGFQSNPEYIKRALSIDVELAIIQEGISKLLRANLLSYDDNGNLYRTQDHLSTRNDISKSEVHNYYRQVLDLAKDSIKLPLDEREFQCFSFAVEEEQIPLIKEAIREFRAKITSLPRKKAERLYHMNIQLFPLSHPLRELENKTRKNSENLIQDSAFN